MIKFETGWGELRISQPVLRKSNHAHHEISDASVREMDDFEIQILWDCHRPHQWRTCPALSLKPLSMFIVCQQGLGKSCEEHATFFKTSRMLEIVPRHHRHTWRTALS